MRTEFFQTIGEVWVTRVVLSRRNLLSLLAKLDGHPPNSACTISGPDFYPRTVIVAEEDEPHYHHPSRGGGLLGRPGPMHHATEAALPDSPDAGVPDHRCSATEAGSRCVLYRDHGESHLWYDVAWFRTHGWPTKPADAGLLAQLRRMPDEAPVTIYFLANALGLDRLSLESRLMAAGARYPLTVGELRRIGFLFEAGLP